MALDKLGRIILIGNLFWYIFKTKIHVFPSVKKDWQNNWHEPLGPIQTTLKQTFFHFHCYANTRKLQGPETTYLLPGWRLGLPLGPCRSRPWCPAQRWSPSTTGCPQLARSWKMIILKTNMWQVFVFIDSIYRSPSTTGGCPQLARPYKTK